MKIKSERIAMLNDELRKDPTNRGLGLITHHHDDVGHAVTGHMPIEGTDVELVVYRKDDAACRGVSR